MPRYDIGDRALWAYIAGFLDGEGCISIAASSGYPSLQVTANNTEEEPLLFIQKVFGGSIYWRRPTSVKCKDVYCWSIHGSSAIEVLEILLPFLIVKKERALLAIEFGLTSSIEGKARIAAKLGILNKRGR